MVVLRELENRLFFLCLKMAQIFFNLVIQLGHEVKDMENIEKMIDEKKKQMAESLKKGNSVEIHASKDGIKVYEVRKKKI
jgi:hypothetical protein|nr:MAG TPA: hypothetical protein [Caudoviricetes sp.]DAV78828.1 MAG TPA: hypothetical protein [Caudoviricetes sp.]